MMTANVAQKTVLNIIPILERSDISQRMTGEELFALPDNGRTELVQGEVIRMAPTGYLHGIIEVDVASILRDFIRQENMGHVLSGEVGIYTQRDPDTVRAADVAYISNGRFARVQSKSYLDIAPELIVEILSPGDSWHDVADKIDEYFDIEVKVVWLINPKKREVFVYHAPTQVTRLTSADTLTEPQILPGFEAMVKEFF